MPPSGEESRSSPKRPNMFTKGMKKLTKSSSILNFNSVLGTHHHSDIHPQNHGDDDDKPHGDLDNFQAIEYNSISGAKEPIHVMHLPDRSDYRESPRKVSTGSNSSSDRLYHTQSPLYSPDHRNNSITSGSAVSLHSLDPKSRNMSGETYPGLAQVGLNLAGYGLSNEDLTTLPPPIPRLGKLSRNPSMQKSSQLNPSYTESKPSLTDVDHRPSLQVNTRIRRPSYTSNLSSSNTSTKPNTTPPSHILQSFSNFASNINQVPDPLTVDQLFERLLSIRAFSDRAMQKLRQQPTKRKWELLLRESETNINFDLKSMLHKTITLNSQDDEEFGSESRKVVTNNSDLESYNIQHSLSSGSGSGSINNGSLSNVATGSNNNNQLPISKSIKRKVKEGSPEWYVYKIFAGKLNSKDYKKLDKKLSTSDKHHDCKLWTKTFVKVQGEAALSVILSRINKKSIKSNEEFDREYLIIKCLKNIVCQSFNGFYQNNYEPDNDHENEFIYSGFANKLHIIKSIVFSLTSPRLATRILVTEVLIFLSYNQDPESLSLILESMQALQDQMGDYVRFQPWLSSFESFLDKYFVGDRTSKITHSGSLKDYCLTTLLLVNSIIEKASSIKLRINIRRELGDSRIDKIFDKLRVVNDIRINEEIEKYESFGEDDYNSFFGIDNSSIDSYDFEEQDLDGIYNQLKQQYLSKDLLIESELKGVLGKLMILKDTGRSNDEVHKLMKLASSVIQSIFTEAVDTDNEPDITVHASLEKYLNKNEDLKNMTLRTEELEQSNKELKLEILKLKNDSSRKVYNENLEILKGENLLSADKIVEQDNIIKQLKQQMNMLKESKETKAIEPTIKRIGPVTGNNSMIDELQSKFTRGSESNPIVIRDQRLWNSKDDNKYGGAQIFEGKEENRGVIMELKDNQEKIRTPRPPTPPLVFPKFDDFDFTQNDKNFNDSTLTTGKFQFSDVSQTGHGNVDTQDDYTNVANQAPLPPPVPQFLQKLSASGGVSDNAPASAVTSAPAVAAVTPPPPPPPSIPQFLEKLSGSTNSVQSTSTPAPPPPPPVPQFLGRASGTAIPIPPPVPQFLGKVPGTGAPVPPPPPPPVPSLLTTSRPGTPPPPPPPPFPPTKPEQNSTTSTPTPEISVIEPKFTIPSIKPKSKLKQMHWDKIDDIDETFWPDIEHSKLSEQLQKRGVLDEVEKKFVAINSTIKKRKDIGESAEKKKLSLLSRDLAQQFGINLHMFASIEVEELVNKVLGCDKEVMENTTVLEFFNNDTLSEINETLIRNFKPYSRVVSDPESMPKKDPKELERPDRVYLELCFNLRHYWKSRSRAILLVHTYNQNYLDLSRKLRVIDEANKSIRNSESLKHVLGIIRSVGNFMNEDSKKALGFKLDTLQRLKFMKDESNSMHFLHYIEKIIRNTFPEYGSFVDELNILTHISNISIEQIETDCGEFERSVNAVVSSVDRGNLSDNTIFHPNDEVIKKIKSPLESAKIKISIIKSHLKKTVEEHNALMIYFGENIKDSYSRNSFYEKFSIFINEFKKAHIENVQKEEEQNLVDARKKIIETTKANREKKLKDLDDQDENIEIDSEKESITGADGEDGEEVGDQNDNNDNDQESIMDTLLEKLKSSAPSYKSTTSSSRRRKALSFYSSTSLDKPVFPHSHGELGDSQLSVNTDDDDKHDKEYESINDLKRRLTKRKAGNFSTTSLQSDSTLMRTQTMLKQLRSDVSL